VGEGEGSGFGSVQALERVGGRGDVGVCVKGPPHPAVDLSPMGEDQEDGPTKEKTTGQPTRSKKAPSWLTGYELG
jgi:hypothetical protein